MKGSRKLSRKVHSFLIQYFLLRVYCISLRQELLIQNRKVQHSLNLRDAKFFSFWRTNKQPVYREILQTTKGLIPEIALNCHLKMCRTSQITLTRDTIVI